MNQTKKISLVDLITHMIIVVKLDLNSNQFMQETKVFDTKQVL